MLLLPIYLEESTQSIRMILAKIKNVRTGYPRSQQAFLSSANDGVIGGPGALDAA